MNEKEVKVFFCVSKLHLWNSFDIAKETGLTIEEVDTILRGFQKQKVLQRRRVGYRVKYWRIQITPEGLQLAKELFGTSLKTCPLCGGNLSTYSVHLAGREIPRVKCERCGRRWYYESH